jgi:chromate reductase, NAD(P)H dehydrogenase (quinone)
MTRILGISGSLGRGSYNTALLRAGAPLLDGEAELQIALLHGIPLYDGDLEAAAGLPQAVRDLRRA